MLGVGLGVGGSMPTDGTLFLENVSQHKHYLLTGLSTLFVLIFWSIVFTVRSQFEQLLYRFCRGRCAGNHHPSFA